MGGKPKDREITYKNFIGLKISDQQLEYLQTRAERLGITQSEYIRRLLNLLCCNLNEYRDPHYMHKNKF